MKRTIILTLCILASVQMADAQNIFNLRQCIETGLERNYAIRIVRNEQLITENNATLGNAGYLPTADVSTGFSGTVRNHNDRYAGGTSQKLTGVNNETADVGLNVSWTVFDGFGIQAEYERLKELNRMDELTTRLTIEDFVASIASEYYNLVHQKIRLQNLRSTLELSKERLRIVEERYYIGSMSRLDLQQAKVDFNSDSSTVLNQLEVVHRSRIRLNELMALDNNELMALDNIEEQIQLKDSLIYPNPFLDEIDLWRNTLETNASLLIAQKNHTLSELDYKKVRSRNYPYVRLNMGYGYTANWYDQSETELQRRLGLNYGVTVGINIFDGFNRKREQRNARLQIQN